MSAPSARDAAAGLSRARAHLHALGQPAYVAPLLTHVGLAGMFLALGVGELAVFHALSVAAIALFLRWHAGGFVHRAFVGFAVQGVLHVVAASVFVGWDTGYHFFLVPLAVIAAVSPGVSAALRLSCFFGVVGCYAAGFVVLAPWPPLHTLSSFLLRWMPAANLVGALIFAGSWGMQLARRLAEAEDAATEAHARSEALLANILPQDAADRLKAGDTDVSEAFDEVTVVFADVVGFTPLSARTPPDELVRILDGLFTRMDALAESHGVEKIKTIGDAYMAAAGVPRRCDNPAAAVAAFALDVRDMFAGMDKGPTPLRVRIGLATGPVVAGVIGRTKFSYDVWGDTVNTAARMESSGEPGRVQIDVATRERLGAAFRCAERGVVEVKGKGPMRTWFLEARA